jgi:hypothetical protein
MFGMGGNFDSFVVGLVVGAVVGLVWTYVRSLFGIALALAAAFAIFLLVDRGVGGFAATLQLLVADMVGCKFIALGAVLGAVMTLGLLRRRGCSGDGGAW